MRMQLRLLSLLCSMVIIVVNNNYSVTVSVCGWYAPMLPVFSCMYTIVLYSNVSVCTLLYCILMCVCMYTIVLYSNACLYVHCILGVGGTVYLASDDEAVSREEICASALASGLFPSAKMPTVSMLARGS